MPPMEEIAESIQELTATPSPSPAPAPAPETSPAPEPSPAPAPADGRPRDTSGRFAPKTESQGTTQIEQSTSVAASEGEQGAAPAMPPAPKPTEGLQPLRPPISWRAEEREGWEQMAPHHQQAILRRDLETQQALSQSARAREFTGAMQQVLQPYMPMIQAEGVDVVSATAELFKTAAILRTAPPLTKAQLVADLIVRHGVDPVMLDQAYGARVQGQPMQADPMQGIIQAIEQRLAPIQQHFQSIQQKEQQQYQQLELQASQSLEQFAADPKNEFFQDVAEDIADLLELATKRGLTLTLQEAYRRATMAHPTISKIIERRTLQGGAAQQSAAAERARQASASVTDSGSPSQVEVGTGDDIRSALTASIQSLAKTRI